MRNGVAIMLVGVVVLAALASGCSRGSNITSGAVDGVSKPGPTVTITAGAYTPRVLTAKTGDTITWRNADSVAHIVSGSGFVSGRIAPGSAYSHRFETPGTYQYTDTGDPSLEGVIVVR